MANIQRMTPQRLGEIFTHSGLIKSEQLDDALEDQKKSGQHLGEILVERNLVTERDVAEAIARQFSLPYLSPSQYYVPSEIAGIIPIDVIQKHRIIPIDKMGKILMVIIDGPVHNKVLDQIERDTDSTLQVYVGTITDVGNAIDKLLEAERKAEAKKKPASDTPLV